VLKNAFEDKQILCTLEGGCETYQPATVSVVPAAGSDPDAGSTAYEMVELVGMEVASFKIARSPL
jgi:hypothetical protein